MKILITAFEAFNNKKNNVSLETLKRLNDDYIKIVLPVSYKQTPNVLIQAIDVNKPDIIICLGEAGGEQKIRLEKVAINYTRASICDNNGELRQNGCIFNGPTAYFCSMNIEKIYDFVKEKFPVYISLSAGGYICNLTYYTALHYYDKPTIFIHLPYYEGQIDDRKIPSMPLDKIVLAIEEIINYIRNE